MRATRLPYGRQTVDESDIQAVVEALRSSHLTTGPRVSRFEEEFASVVGARHAVAVSSGTAALHAAAFAAGIQPGTEAITTPLTFAATANCVRYLGGAVVFADVRPDTLTIDPEAVERSVTSATRAILAVDFAGQPADLDPLLEAARRRGLMLIEDACHALGATYRDRPVGSIADLSIFSFHPVKHVTSGEGGMVTTQDAGLAERVRMFRNHGITVDYRARERTASWEYAIEALGFNYRLTDIQSARGTSQLRKLDRWVARRRAIAREYGRAFDGMAELTPVGCAADRSSSWHLYPVCLNLERLRAGRREIFEALQAENIGVNVHYIPVPWHPYYQRLGYRKGSWPAAESAYERLLSLPIFPAMTDEDVADVITAVRKVADAYAA